MTQKEINHELRTIPLSNMKHLFLRYFDINHLFVDLMEEVPQAKLRRFMAENFIKEFSTDELTHIIRVEQFEA